MDIKKIGVIGAGTMGSGIAQLFALHDYPVTLVDREEGLLEAALDRVREHTDPEKWDMVSARIRLTTNAIQLDDCDIVIEAVFERMDVKKTVFESIKGKTKPNAIIATNTSSFSIDELSGYVEDAGMFIGMHFMNPPKVMKLVEVIKGPRTLDAVTEIVTGLAEKLDKIPAIVNDSPGFVSNRLLFALIGEAMRLLQDGVAKKESIDIVMQHGMNHPMGPIRLADFIGLDVCKEIMSYIHEQSGDDKFQPPAVLLELIDAGKLGKKTNEGFYKYE